MDSTLNKLTVSNFNLRLDLLCQRLNTAPTFGGKSSFLFLCQYFVSPINTHEHLSQQKWTYFPFFMWEKIGIVWNCCCYLQLKIFTKQMNSTPFVVCYTILFATVTSLSDTTFLHFQWKNYILANQAKPWNRYIHKMLESSIAGSQSVATLLTKIYKKVIQYKHKSVKSEMFRNDLSNCSAYVAKTHLTKPTGNLIFTVFKKNIVWCGPFAQHKILINADNSVCLNLTFIQFQIKEKLRGCRRANLTIYSFNISISYCGVLPTFTHYSMHPNITVDILFFEYIPMNIAVAYSVFSKRTVSSMKSRTSIKVNPIALHVWLLGILVFTYHLTTLKYQQICVHNLLQFDVVLIDGPDFSAVPVAITSNDTCLTTFQYLLQIQMPEENSKIPLFQINYTGQDASSTTEWRYNGSYFVTIPTKNCRKASLNFCVLIFSSPNRYHVNLTTLRMFFQGLSTDDCKYGGLSFYDGRQHVVDLCKNIDGQLPPRNIIFKERALIKSYSYPGVSAINTFQRIEITRCRPIWFDICNFNFWCHVFGQKRDCLRHLESISNNSVLQFEHSTDSFLEKMPIWSFCHCSHMLTVLWYSSPVISGTLSLMVLLTIVTCVKYFSFQIHFLSTKQECIFPLKVLWRREMQLHCQNLSNLKERLMLWMQFQYHGISLTWTPLKWIAKTIPVHSAVHSVIINLWVPVVWNSQHHMNFNMIIKHIKAIFEEDVVIVITTSIDVGISLLPQDIFSVRLVNASYYNHQISQTKRVMIMFTAEGLTQVAADRLSPAFCGTWMGIFHLSCHQKQEYFAAPGALK